MGTFTIELKDLKFHAAHGLHAEEKLVGTTFMVDVFVNCRGKDEMITDIGDTVDYVRIYEIVKGIMSDPTPLLETCCMKIAEKVENDFPLGESVAITITKLSPPISNFIGKVAVSYRKSFDK